MKKITYYFSMIFMAVMMLSLTSCDEDAEIAYALNGTWKGIMQTQLDYEGRYYQSNKSEVTFNSGYDSGDGYWIDYYSNAPWDYVANRITWRVSGTTIISISLILKKRLSFATITLTTMVTSVAI